MVAAVETMAYAGEVPWHGLGVKVRPDLTPEEMLNAAELNWEVEKVPLTYTRSGQWPAIDDDGTELSVPNKFGLIRKTDGRFYDVVGPNWNPLQNEQAFEFFHDFVEKGDMEMHTAGSLHDGQYVWALAKIKESFEVIPGDVIDAYLLFVNPHKRGKAIQVKSTPVRVVCWNTMSYALEQDSAGRQIKIHHNQQWDEDTVKEMLGLAHQSLTNYQEVSQFIASKRWNKETLTDYFNLIFPNTGTSSEDSKNSILARDVIHKQPGTELGEGSWWQAFNTVTYLTDHELGRSADTRLSSAWMGVNLTRKNKALNLAHDFAKAA
jgi:phage/plasmid-like protein (TIGR03299 family)